MSTSQAVVQPVEPGHIPGIMRLCKREGWPSFLEDPDRTWRALTAPGVITAVARVNGQVAGFAQLQTDGLVQAHLSLIVVDSAHRRQGIGRRLIEDCFARAGVSRIDLISTEGSDAFYDSFPHRRFPGYRIYPGGGHRASS